MADEIVMTVKSNIKQQAADVNEWSTSLKGAAGEAEALTESVKVQNSVLIDMEKELVKLEETQAKLGKGSWKDSLTGTTKKIEAQKLAIKGERVALKDLKNQQKDATGEVKKFNKAQDDQAKAIKGGIGNFQLMGVSLNGVKSAFGKIIPTAKAMFGTIKAGLISTGIGAFIVLVGSLGAYFLSTKEGMDKLAVTMAKIGAAVDVLKDRIAGFGKIISNIFSKPLSESINDVKENFKGMGEELVKETEAAGDLVKATQKLRDANNDFIIMQAEKNRSIAEARLLAKDETKSQEERLEALNNAVAMEKELLGEQLANQAEKVRILQEQTDMSNSTAEDEKALAEQKVILIEMETASIMKMRTLKRETNTLENELAQEELDRIQFIADEKARIQAEADEAAAILKAEKEEADLIKAEEDEALRLLEEENMLAGIENLRERALAEIEIEYQAELKKYENHANFVQLKEQLDIKYTAAKKALDVQELKWSDVTTKQKLNMAKGAFDSIASMLGKESKAGKAAAIASATISTFQGATSAFASLAPIPFVGPVLGGIAAAGAIVAGFKNIQAIRKGGGGGTVSAPPPMSTGGGASC